LCFPSRTFISICSCQTAQSSTDSVFCGDSMLNDYIPSRCQS
jgi:hypothetical protein